MRKDIQDKIANSNKFLIDLNNMDIDDKELKEIADEIKRVRPAVQTLSLDNNKISDAGAITLGVELQSLAALSFLNLQFNQIDVKGARAVMGLKATHPGLKFALHGNKIGDQGLMDEIEKSSF